VIIYRPTNISKTRVFYLFVSTHTAQSETMKAGKSKSIRSWMHRLLKLL